MIHLTAGIFGNADFAKELARKLGKKGTANDIEIYNHGSSEGVFTYVTVNSDKVQPLMQAVNMSDVAVLAANRIDAALGEQIVAINETRIEKGFIILEGLAAEQISPLIKGTCIEGFNVVDEKHLPEELKSVEIERGKELEVPIDNSFEVKGVGTVALGVVKCGTIRRHDKAVIEPAGKEISVKSIQSQDKDIEQAEAGTRVGLCLKGIEASEIKRGYVIGEMKKSKNLTLKFERNRYSEQLKEGEDIFLCSGLQVLTARITSVRESPKGDGRQESPDGDALLEVSMENEIAYRQDTRFLAATGRQKMPRIIGHGIVANQ